MKQKIPTFVFGMVICLVASSCMGVNAVHTNWYGADITANTNPVPEYANGFGIAYQGGAIAHIRSTPGQIGNAKAVKEGKACATGFLWLLGIGDSSISTAASEGGISKIASTTFENQAFLGFLFHRQCTVVTGE